MSPETSLERAIREYRNDPEFILEGMLWDVNDQIARSMRRQGINRAELAKRLKTSRSYVTKLLRGTTNITLQSLARIAVALGTEISVTLSASPRPTEVHVRTAARKPVLQLLYHARHPQETRTGARPSRGMPMPSFASPSESETRDTDLVRFRPAPSAPCDGRSVPVEQRREYA